MRPVGKLSVAVGVGVVVGVWVLVGVSVGVPVGGSGVAKDVLREGAQPPLPLAPESED